MGSLSAPQSDFSIERKLEDYLARELDVATLCGIRRQAFGATEACRHEAACCYVSFAAGYVQISVVEDVEGFKTQLQSYTLRDLKVLIHRRIKVPEAGTPENVA